MRHHQADRYSHYKGPRRRRQREKRAEDVFAEIMTENSLGKRHSDSGSPESSNPDESK